MPVVHCHDFELHGLSSDVETNWHLVEHIAVCHRDVQIGGEHSSWHVHFVLPHSGDKGNHELPLGDFDLSELITHDAGSHEFDVPVSSQSSHVLADFVGPYSQPALSPSVPKLIPLAPPRQRPSRVSPRLYYCVAQC